MCRSVYAAVRACVRPAYRQITPAGWIVSFFVLFSLCTIGYAQYAHVQSTQHSAQEQQLTWQQEKQLRKDAIRREILAQQQIQQSPSK